MAGAALAAGVMLAIGPATVTAQPLASGRQVKAPSSLACFQKRLERGALAGWSLWFITIDTLRADHVGCYGYAGANTPTIDGLAKRGVQFDHAVTPVPSTLPAHCTMMTGLDPPNHGVRTNGHYTLDDDVTTLAELLKGKGYATAALVGTFVLDRRFGLSQGFDHYQGIVLPNRKTGRRSTPRHAQIITDEGIAWLTGLFATNLRRPFFLWTHYFDPHLPYDPPGAFTTRFADSPYDGEIAYADSHIGRLLDFLRARDQIDRTLIVLTADHGEGLGEHLEKDHSRLVYDTTVHIPLILSCPQLHRAPCRVDDVTVGAVDIMPTVLSLLGIETDIDMDGVDLTVETVRRDRAMYVETLSPLVYHGWASLHGLRRIDAKYIDAPRPEYYDLAHDPHELNNLLEADPTKALKLAAELAAYMARWPRPEESATRIAAVLDANTARRLAALGYVSAKVAGDAQAGKRADPKDMLPIFDDLRRNDAQQLRGKSWDIVNTADADKGAYRRALILAKAAHHVRPEDPAYQTTLGVAYYRAGNHAAAAQALTRSEKNRSGGGEKSDPATLAFRAMALYRLGRIDQARAELQRLRTVVNDTAHASLGAAHAYLAEAEATILDNQQRPGNE